TYRDFIQDRFPGLQLEICTDFVNAGDILRRVEPAIVLAAKSKRQTFPRDALVSAPSVRWIHSTSAGIDHLVRWDKKRVSVTNSRGLFGDAMAQYVMSMVLAQNLRLRLLFFQQACQSWKPFEWPPTEGQTLLVLGSGQIGRRVARIAK